jgi:hypothetical protein
MLPLRTAAGIALALLISSGSAAFAETSRAGGCGWVRGAATAKSKPKFSLGVALRVFSFSRAPVNAVDAEMKALEEAELRDSERIEAELASQATQLGLQPPRRGLPRIFSWMRGWRFEKDGGLFRPVRTRSRFAFAYSDIFETGGDPDRGGHGLGFLFRRDLGPSSQRRLN